MKKIVLISPLPPPVGGIASWTVNILEYFKNYSNDKYVLEHLNNAMQLRSITSTSKLSRIYYGIINFLLFYRKLVKKLLQKPDLCHFTSSASLGLFKDVFFILTCRIFNIKTVIHYRFGRIPDLYLIKNWEWKTLQFVNKMSTFVVVLDKKSLDILNKYHKHVSLIENPVSSKLIDFKKVTVKTERNAIVFVGHVTKKKGIYEFFEATKNLHNKYKLEIVGPYENEVKEYLLEKYNRYDKQIVFYGAMSNEMVYNKMINSTLLVLPSYTEGFPNVIIEGMALGCGIIATDVGAIPDMLGENRGVLISPRNADQLRDAIHKLLFNESIRNEFSLNAESYALANYTMGNIVKKLEFIWTYENTK